MSLIEWCYLFFQVGLILFTARVYFRLGKEKGRKVAAATVSKQDPAIPVAAPILPSVIADLLVLVWKMGKKSDDTNPRSVLRTTERVLSVGEKNGFQLRTYHGTRLLPGSRVQVVDTVPGPEGLVVEDLEPEVLFNGLLVRPAAVTVGKDA